MWKWYSADESQPPGVAPDSQEGAGTMSVADLTEQLAQTEQLVIQLKELIREKDNELRKKDQQLKEEKDSCDAKVSKAKLQNKAKIASLTSQLEDLRKQLGSPNKQEKRSEHRKGSGDGDHENASANRGKILVLKKRIEELESQLSLKNEDLKKKEAELESQRLRGSEIDIMLAEKEKKLAEKEAYIVELQVSTEKYTHSVVEDSQENAKNQKDSSNQELQTLIHNLTRKVGESEERCSLLQEQAETLKSLLSKEKNDYQEKEAMYTENIRVYQNMILEKEKELKELSQKHEQDLFKLAAKSDASADLHQLLKALKQKLHEEEEVLLGKNQVIDVLQKELDNKDQQFMQLNERCKRLQSEKDNLQSKLDAEKHVMRAQLRDMMDKHETELRCLNEKHSSEIMDIQEKHEAEIQEKCQTVLRLQKQLQDLGSAEGDPKGSTEGSSPVVAKLQEEVKSKTEEASKSEAKFLKMKAWSKSRIRQLEEELKTSEAKNRDLDLLTSQISELEQDKRELESRLESLTGLQSVNEHLLAKLVIYEEQQRKLQADLEQVAKRADSQTSESGSVDELQTQLLEWNEMNSETEQAPDRDHEEKSVLAMRMAQIEEEREAMDSGQQELEEELSTARGMGKLRQARRKSSKGPAKPQDELDYGSKRFEDENLTLDSIDSEGENMGGLRTVVEELELERNQLQEQIMALEERCQELEDRLQLQVRIETLQNENERLLSQISQFRQQQSRESEKHHHLVSTLNEQVKSLTDRNVFLENAMVEKEQTLQEASRKLESLGTLQKTLQEKELHNKELCEKLDHSEHQLEDAKKKQMSSETENSALKLSNGELTEMMSAFKDKISKQESSLQKMQLDLDQTNEELDRLNTSHLEERSQLIHDLQRCEREMDILKDALQEKDKEVTALAASLSEYTEQVALLKEQLYFKEDQMREMSDALVKAERELHLLRDTQSLDTQETNSKISSLSEQLGEMDAELSRAQSLSESKSKEAEELIRQISENGVTIKNLRSEIHTQAVTHNNHVTECSAQITSLKEQLNASVAKLDETETKYRKEIECLKSQLEKDNADRDAIAGLLEEKSNKERNFENELKLAKEQHNRLVCDVSTKDKEIERLSNLLGEQKDLCDKLNRDLQSKEERLSSLQQTSESVLTDNQNKLETLQNKIQELQNQLAEKCDVINRLQADSNELHTQNKNLERALEERDQALAAQMNLAEETQRKVQNAEEEHQLLSSERGRLLEALSLKESEVSSLNQTLLDLQSKMTNAENLLAEEQVNASNLRSEREELLAKVEDISAQCAQKDSIAAAQLDGKAAECLSLKEQLAKEQEVSSAIQAQMRSLENELTVVQERCSEKDNELQARILELNAVSENLTQNQEKCALLLKQVGELAEEIERRKLELQEKGLAINALHGELEESKMSFEKLKDEEQQQREQNAKAAKRVEGLTVECDRLQQEVIKTAQENDVLRKSVDNGIKETERLSQEKEEVTLSLSNYKSQCDSLQSQVVQSESEIGSLKQALEALKHENLSLASDIELANAALASKSQEIGVLSSHLSQQGHTIMSLNDQIDTLSVEKQTLLLSVEQKDTLLAQKEELIKETEKRLEGEGHYLQTISALQNELHSSASAAALLQQKIQERESELQKLSQEVKLYKDKSEEAELLRAQLSEHVEVISDLHRQLQDLREGIDTLNATLTKRDESLKEKVDSYASLQAEFSELKDTLEVQKRRLESLAVENEQYKTHASEKDLTIKDLVSGNEDLKQILQGKEEQCVDFTQRITHLEEMNRTQTSELHRINSLIEENKASLIKKDELISSQSLEMTGLQDAVQELTNKIKALEQSTTDKEDTVQNLQDKYASLYEDKRALEESLVKKEDEIVKLLKAKDEKELSLQAAEYNVKTLTGEVGILQEQLNRVSSDFQNASFALKERDESLSRVQQSVSSLKMELESLNAEYQKSMTQVRELTKEKEQKELLIQDLKEKCGSQSQQIERLEYNLESSNSKFLQDQRDTALQKEQLQLQLESAAQDKLRLEEDFRALQEEKSLTLAGLQKQLTEKADILKELKEKKLRYVEESKAQARSNNHLKDENADLHKQVSGQAEEICALKVNISNLEQNLTALQQQIQSVNEQNVCLGKHSSSLEAEIQIKENALHILHKDLRFVEEQLSLLCDESFSEYSSSDCQSDCQSKLEKLSAMFCVASNYKSGLSELKLMLAAKDKEIVEREQSIVWLEKEREDLKTDLQKLKGELSKRESLMEELAALKESSYQQQCILQEREVRLQELNVCNGELQKALDASKDEQEKSRLSLDQELRRRHELVEDAKKTDLLVQGLNVQLNHQKELIAALSDQVKEKDASLMHVMESMSNEMVRFTEEKNMLNLELQNLQSAKGSFELEVQNLSGKLEACVAELQLSQKALADKESLLSNLANEKDLQLEKVNKEKESLKRKLQAALVIRKDLMLKIEQLENGRRDDLCDEQLKSSELRTAVEELNCKLESTQNHNDELQSQVQLLKQEITEKEVNVSELGRLVAGKDAQLGELQNQVLALEHTISEKDNACKEHSRVIHEKELYIAQVKDSLTERVRILEEENSHLLENLKSHLEKIHHKADDPAEEQVVSINNVNSGVLNQENPVLNNNVHTSLLCSGEDIEATKEDKQTADPEILDSSVQEFERLKVDHADLLNAYDTKCKEHEQITAQMLCLRNQMQVLEEQLTETKTQLGDKEIKLEEQQRKIEDLSRDFKKAEQYEKMASELELSIRDKEEEIVKLTTQHEHLLSESQMLRDEKQQLLNDKESMAAEINMLQKSTDAYIKEIERLELTAQQVKIEKDKYFETCNSNRAEIEKLKHDLEAASVALLEKDTEMTTLKDSLLMHRTASEELGTLQTKLNESYEETHKLQMHFDQVREELEDNLKKLEKANAEIMHLRETVTNSRKEEEKAAQRGSSPRLHQDNADSMLVLHDTTAPTENIQDGDNHLRTICDDCSRKQHMIEELENKFLQNAKEKESLEQRLSEEGKAKEKVQRKLQAALISRKDLLKENKSQHDRISSLSLEIDELKHSMAIFHENKSSEFSELSLKNKELLSENEKLLLVNENLSAACESLKSTMETIVQEKEAFSFQLNSLKDSQTVELSGWKAKHSELNREYESLLQAYENISDEIGKMRQVIEVTKKEKHEMLHEYHDIQGENNKLQKHIQEALDENDELIAKLESREKEIQSLQAEFDRQADSWRSGAELEHKLEELSLQNHQLIKDNKELQENYESMKMLLENNEQEKQKHFVSKSALDGLQVDLNTYKADVEVKMSELLLEKETLSNKVTELSRELSESEQSLAKTRDERRDLQEKLSNVELSLKQENSRLLQLESDVNSLHSERVNLNEKVKILEDDKALLQEEMENVQEQFYKLKNERENLEAELLKAGSNNNRLSDKFKSLQVQTNLLSQQVESLRAEKNNIERAKEEHQLQLLRELEGRVKCAQDDNIGTKSKSKELQELLKEKQQEINQLQRDSIRFQELILDLEGMVKDSNGQLENLKKELGSTNEDLVTMRKDVLHLKQELSEKEQLLQRTTKKMSYLTTQLRRFMPELESNGELVTTHHTNEVIREVTPRLTGESSLDVKERLKQSRENGDKDSNDLLDKEESNGMVRSRRKEGDVQYRTLGQLEQEDVENEVKAMQNMLLKQGKDMKQVLSEKEKLKTDLEKQVTISKHMKLIIDNKDAEISALLSSKDGQVSSYLSQVQSQYRKQIEDYEHQLSSLQVEKEGSDKECQRLKTELNILREQYEKALNDKNLISNEVEAFRKSMSSLQTDRDLLCSELKDMHSQHETLLNQKDEIIISSSSENNTLQQEVRILLNQIDDLNAENAMLGAQLIRYREDLNQVLSLKDHQLKELLRQKLDHIKNLEQEKCDLQKQYRDMQNTNSSLKRAAEALELENKKLNSKATDQEALIAAINKGKIFFESKKQTYQGLGKRDEEEDDERKLSELQNGSDDQRPGRSENKEEKSDRSYGDLYNENKELKSQNESFGKAMAALQNNRDSLIEDFKVLQWRYAEELKAEKIRGDGLERQLDDFRTQLYSILKKNSLLSEALLSGETFTLEQLSAGIETVCSRLISGGLEVTRLSSECTNYKQQIDAFSKALASLQHDRERLLHQLVRDVKQGTPTTVPTNAEETEYFTMDKGQPQTDKITQVREVVSNSAAEFSTSRPKVEELERRLQEANNFKEKAEREITSYQYELAEIRSEKNILAKEAQVLRHELNASLADKDRQIAELRIALDQSDARRDVLGGAKNLERVALVGGPVNQQRVDDQGDDKAQPKHDVQRYLQEIRQKDLIIQQVNAKAMEAVEMNALLSAQLNTLSQGLKEAQKRYSDLQNQHYRLQRDFQSKQATNQNDLRADVAPAASREKASVLVEVDGSELTDLRRRFAEMELHYKTTQRDLAKLSDRLMEEKSRREAAEEALNLSGQQSQRPETKSASRDYEFSLQMESEDEREALIIDPTQNVMVRKMKGGALSLRRWLHGRSLYCSKLLTARSKSRYLFLSYLLVLHALVLMCLTGVL